MKFHDTMRIVFAALVLAGGTARAAAAAPAQPKSGFLTVPGTPIAGPDGAVMTPGPPQTPNAFLGSWRELAPHRVWLAYGSFDTARNQLLVFGGLTQGGSTNRVVGYTHATREWRYIEAAGMPPSARYNVPSLYDPIRDRLLIFGGFASLGGYQNDVWALSLSGTPTWTPLSPTGTPPAARGNHTLIYDSLNDRMIVFGGTSGALRYNDVWSLSLGGTPAWSVLTPSGTPPTPRNSHAAVYDVVGARMVVFGGDGAGGAMNEVWSLSLPFGGATAWTQLAPSGTPPTPRFASAAIYDAVGKRMVLYAGHQAGGNTNDVWALDLNGPPAWSELVYTGDPSFGVPHARQFHSAAFYPATRPPLLIAFGGLDEGDKILGDTWAFDLEAHQWSARTPIPRLHTPFVHDPVRDRLVFFGGYDDNVGWRNEVWTTDLGTLPNLATNWSVLETSGIPPGPRVGHGLIYDPSGDRLVVFGGELSSPPFANDLWELTLGGTPTWTPITPSGTPPEPRWGAAVIYDSLRDRLVLFGGKSALGNHQDVWAVNLSGAPAWTQLLPSGGPPAVRARMPAVYDEGGDRMVFFGGDADITGYNDTWALSFAPSPVWTQLPATGGPPAVRTMHANAYDPARRQMVVFGGGDFTNFYNDVWSMGLASPEAWNAPSPTSPNPHGRMYVTGGYDPTRDRLLIAFGFDGVSFLTDVWALDRTGVVDAPRIEAVALRLGSPAPNPFRDRVTLALERSDDQPVVVTVHDLAGRIVRTLTFQDTRRSRIEWDGRNAAGVRLPRGLYFVRAQSGAQVTSAKVMIGG